MSKYQLSRLGRKLQCHDDQRALVALPRDVPERTWAEIMLKEENDLLIFEIREEILETALNIGYEHYMEKQTVAFTVHCASEAWLKLIDWFFYRHDPGEDPTAFPACMIPRRTQSWTPDQMPKPSPKDSWCKHDLEVIESEPEGKMYQKWPSTSSLEFPPVDDIPEEFWFPGKVELENKEAYVIIGHQVDAKLRDEEGHSGSWVPMRSDDSLLTSHTPSDLEEDLAAESEVLQKITDYSSIPQSRVSTLTDTKTLRSVEGSLQGAGDSTISPIRAKTRHASKSSKSRIASKGAFSKSRTTLPPLEGSMISVVSDCRLRSLRLDTQHEVFSERIDSLPILMTNKKK